MLIRSVLVPAAIVLAALPGPFQARQTVDLEAADCSRYQASWGELQTAYGTRRTSVPVSAATLEVTPEDNGGVQVLRGSGNTYSITACIAAGAGNADDARHAIDGVNLVVNGNRVTTTGAASSRHVSVQLVVEAPQPAQIHATTKNGPIGVEDVEGTFTAEAANGPVSLQGVRGTVTARSQNGPITIRGGSGTFDAEASNGPIAVTLEGTQWKGRLDVRSQNGPLTVRVPEGFVSGVEISSSSHSPWSCRLSECGTSTRDRDYESSRSLRLGRDPVVVRISTRNGPVAVQQR